MKRLWVLMILLVLCGGAISLAGYFLLTPIPGDKESGLSVSPERGSAAALVAGEVVYVEYCQECHGDQLQGQSNWQTRKAHGRLPAPPHDETGHTWHHPDQVLFAMTKYGPSVMAGQGYESDMPAYDGVLSDAQIWQVLDYIKSTWPDNIRQEQARRTKRMEDAG